MEENGSLIRSLRANEAATQLVGVTGWCTMPLLAGSYQGRSTHAGGYTAYSKHKLVSKLTLIVWRAPQAISSELQIAETRAANGRVIRRNLQGQSFIQVRLVDSK
jgi:hypothetical protein